MRLLGMFIRLVIPAGIVAAIGLSAFSSLKTIESPRIEGFGVEMKALPPVTAENVEYLLSLLQASGAEYIRQEINWSVIETSADSYNWSSVAPLDMLFAGAKSREIKVVAVLTGGPVYLATAGQPVEQSILGDRWEKFTQAAVDHFGEYVEIWEIGMDINGLYGMTPFFYPLSPGDASVPDPVYYTKLLRAASKIIKSSDPNDEVWMGSLVSLSGKECAVNPLSFLLEVNAAKGWKSMDAIPFHPKHGSVAPEFQAARSEGGQCSSNLMVAPTSLATEVQALQELARQLGGKPVIITALGWSESNVEKIASGRAISIDELESDLITRASASLMAQNTIPVIFWELDISTNLSGQHALTNLAHLVDKSKPLGQLQGQEGFVHEYQFRKANETITIAWRSSEGDTAYPVSLTGGSVNVFHAYPADAAVISRKEGLKIDVDSSGTMLTMLNERPVIFIGRSNDIAVNIQTLVNDQMEVWKYELQKSSRHAANDLKAAFLNILEDWFTEAKEQAIEWGEEKIDEILP